MQRVNDYLLSTLNGETRKGESVDLGDDRLNRMMSLLDSHFRRIDERFDKVDERLEIGKTTEE